MAYSPIEERYLSTLTQQQFPDMPVEQVAAEPSLDGMQLAMGGNAAGRRSDRPVSDVPMALLDMGAATAKGAVQGFVGLPGDIEKIGRLLIGAMGGDVGEDTKLPTTEEVKAWLDKNVGKVNDGKNPYESVGEVMAPGGYTKAAKSAVKGKKAAATAAATAPSAIAQDKENK